MGVARDARFGSLGEPPKPHLYRPFSQNYGGVETILVETAASPRAMLETVRRAVALSSAGVRIYGVTELSEWVGRSYWQVRWEVSMLGASADLCGGFDTVALRGSHRLLRARATRRTGRPDDRPTL